MDVDYSRKPTQTLRSIKLAGTLVILLITLTAIILVVEDSRINAKVYELVNRLMNDSDQTPTQFNSSACILSDHFDLTDGVWLTVCRLDEVSIIDIRRFIGGEASILGIPLSLKQWESLKLTMDEIDVAVTSTKNYI